MVFQTENQELARVLLERVGFLDSAFLTFPVGRSSSRNLLTYCLFHIDNNMISYFFFTRIAERRRIPRVKKIRSASSLERSRLLSFLRKNPARST